MISSFAINNTYASRKIRMGILLNKFEDVLAHHERETHKEIMNRLKIESEGNTHYERITYIDMMIADAVYSLYKTEQTSFSEGMILRALSGDDNQTCRSEVRDRITGSLKKMGDLKLIFNCREELENRNIEGFEDIKETFLPLTILKSGKYQNINPPLYEYAELVNQIITIPMGLWNLGNERPVNNSLENIAIKHYLIHRIEVANYKRKGKRKLDNLNKIFYYHPAHKKLEEDEHPFVGMLFDLNIVSEWEKRTGIKLNELGDVDEIRSYLSKLKNPTHKNTVKILNTLKEIGYIKDYELIKGIGKEIIGVEIKGPIKKKDEFRQKKQ